MESTWNQRYEDTKARYEEFCENRVNLMTNLMNNCMKKRKVSNGEYLENFSHQLKDKDDRIDTLEDSNLRLSEQIEKLKRSLKVFTITEGDCIFNPVIHQKFLIRYEK